MSCPAVDAELAHAALRYAAGAMPPAEAEVFEGRLADDQTARDALAEAVRLSAAASGAPAPTPDRLVRQAVVERLHPTWFSRLFPRRPYRGHPLAWAGVGGGVAAAVVVTLSLTLGGNQPDAMTVAHSQRVLPSLLEVQVADGPVVVENEEQVVVGPPAPSRLNPMGMEKRIADCTAEGPSPVITPPKTTIPMPMASAEPETEKVAEVANEPTPMGEPAVGMLMSRL